MSNGPSTLRPGGGGAVGPAERVGERRGLAVGLVLMITMIAFENLGVATAMPVVARDLGGLSLYGWAFTGPLLAGLVGIAVAGRQVDRVGPAPPFVAGLVLFTVGLTVAGTARSMPVLILGRLIQGLGAGAIPPVAYAAIGRAFVDRARARMFALLSTAWVVPGLVGPVIAGTVAEEFGWRWVFLAIVPLALLTGVLALPALGALGRPAGRPVAAPSVPAATVPTATAAAAVGPAAAAVASAAAAVGPTAAALAVGPTAATPANGPVDPRGGSSPGGRRGAGGTAILRGPIGRAATLAVGAGLVVGGLGRLSLVAIPLVTAGVVLAVPPLRALLPAGTGRAAPGLPAAVAARGAQSFAFFGAEAYLPLALNDLRHQRPALAGLTLTGATLAWTAGSWWQERQGHGRARSSFVLTGLLVMTVGIVLGATVVVDAVPVVVAAVGWSLAGLGIGMSYSGLSLIVLAEAAPGGEGSATSALQLSDVLGMALGTGLGGAAIAVGAGAGLSPRPGIAIAFALSSVAAVLACLAARRLSADTTTSPAAAPAGPSAPTSPSGMAPSDITPADAAPAGVASPGTSA